MKSNIANSSNASSNSKPAGSPIYMYFVGEEITMSYLKTEALLNACRFLDRDLAESFDAVPQMALGLMLAQCLDCDRLGVGADSEAGIHMTLLAEAYVAKDPKCAHPLEDGMNSFICTVFRKGNGNYVIRQCAQFSETRSLSCEEITRILGTCLQEPTLRAEFDADGLAKDSVYHTICAEAGRLQSHN